jgi:hypothetical protein
MDASEGTLTTRMYAERCHPLTEAALDSLYLALVPRGLESTACDLLNRHLGAAGWNARTSILGEGDDEKDESTTTTTTACDHYGLSQQRVSNRRRQTDPLVQLACRSPVGTVPATVQTLDVSFGYDGAGLLVKNTAGRMQGTVWLLLQSNAPAAEVANIRALGPILALAGYWNDVQLGPTVDLATARDNVLAKIGNDSYQIEKSFQLYAETVRTSWGLSKEELVELEEKMAESIHYHGSDTPPLTYRLSCVRSDSKNKYTYSRREFLTVVADGAMKLRHCKVNLRHYDFEVCFLVRDHALAIGIALRPYQRIPTTSFAGGDCQPPDIHPPYNVMLDPCVGTGTICSETEFQKSHVAAIGGDLALTPTGLATVAIERQQHSRSRASLVAWDSCCLPIRALSVDVIVSDLPFGQKCSSAHALDRLLPLMASEWARVLRLQTGRMVLLCGSYAPLLQAFVTANEQSSVQGKCVWQLPCTALFPVNIGGNLAWVLQISRGNAPWLAGSNHRERVRKLTARRSLVQAMQKAGGGKTRYLQA